MKQLHYIVRSLWKRKSDNFIKIVSLSLGLTVGLILFARVSFELSYDRFYPDADRLYYLDTSMVMDDEEMDGPQINAPIPAAMYENLPEVEAATITADWGPQPFYYNSKKFQPATLFADSLFFYTFGFHLKSGDPATLAITDNIFLSEKTATLIFGEENPVGQVLLFDNGRPYTVQGIFADIPENCHLKFDAVASFGNISTQFGRNVSWDKGDSYTGYVRLVAGTDPQVVDHKLAQLEELYRDPYSLTERKETSSVIYLQPISRIYMKYGSSSGMLVILSVLALVILVVAAMNYVLISISALPLRTKAVGIHKTNGATYRNIFLMFMYETGILVIAALITGALLLFALRGDVESVTQISLPSLLLFPIFGYRLWLLLLFF